jgi:SAM-dependent methyltransferase
MPLSNYWHIPTVLHYVTALQPSRVLDVGVGMGTYGFLLRQTLDIGHERLCKETWKIALDGVEIFEGYRNPVWDYAYDRVFMGDVRDMLDKVERYDVVICNDVLEHFEEREAGQLITRFLSTRATLIATTPNQDLPQETWGGNEAETHRCLLGPRHFPNLIAWKRTGITNVYICSTRPDHIEVIRRASAHCPVARAAVLPALIWRLKGVGRRISRARVRRASRML